MVKVSNGEIVLESRTSLEFENEGVLNPACVEKDGIVHMFYRAIGKKKISTIGYCQLKNNKVIYRSDKPVLFPEYFYEKKGLEDPRITFLEGKYYLLYTAYDGLNALVAYATSTDLKTWIKKGLISPQISYNEAEALFKNSGVNEKYTFFGKIFRNERTDKVHLWEKDAMLFPKKIKGKYALIHRVLPGIQICYFNDFDQLNQNFWRDYFKELNSYLILDPKYDFENGYIGGGAVPIETDKGWLLIFHSVDTENGFNTYHASVALLDLDDPQKIIGRLCHPLFSPDEKWEIEGLVNNVVFPTGTYVKDDDLFIYYGAADSKIGFRKLSISNLLEELLNENEKTD